MPECYTLQDMDTHDCGQCGICVFTKSVYNFNNFLSESLLISTFRHSVCDLGTE